MVIYQQLTPLYPHTNVKSPLSLDTKKMCSKHFWSWDGSVGIMMGYKLDARVQFLAWARFFSSPQHPGWP
jgi:hypothetical protein